ncbi:NAD-dependent epimerase/dehydratase family protein [Solimonas sp. K1W22B-7]|uniref:NAD-dependent epimerase/dehydratase family protein n=1 Tax=Solimonas sp. K1W22B-7 TaxID=2303331 RepID=UPI000E333689|nr:NAD-dependent epimerase/dehydratase family protein [Solimonas sp. K1W22B-7]AXQ28654.1 NAD-dependent epimerase/dehydratase family protein [Solimonas sp. K1W22B-7]
MTAATRKFVFLTGGSGFLGRQLITSLTGAGYSVRALVRSAQAATTVQALGAEPVSGDLDDMAAMRGGMAGCVGAIHSAAKVGGWGPWEEFLRDTVQGTEHVIAAARAAGLPRLVHISTEAVLADGQPIIEADETRPLPQKPNGAYPRSKGMAEQRVLAANGDGLATVVVRPRFIWGKGDTTLAPRLAEAARRGWVWFGGGAHRSSTCHVRNVAHGVILAMERGGPGEIYFLTDGAPQQFRDFIGRLIRTQGVEPGERNAPLWLADAMAAVCETAWSLLPLQGEPPLTRTTLNLFFREVTVRDDKARQQLGYRPVISVDEGLRELQAAIR